MLLENKIKNQLRKHYTKKWEPLLADAKRIIDSQGFVISYQDDNKPTFEDAEYGDNSDFRHWWAINDPDKKIYDDKELVKKMNDALGERPFFSQTSYGNIYLYYFKFGYHSSPSSKIYFTYEPDSNEVIKLYKDFEKEIIAKENEQRSIQRNKEILKQDELINISKPEALRKAKDELINSTAFYSKIQRKTYEELLKDITYYLDIFPIVESIALKWGLNPKELEEYSFKETKILNDDKFVYCPIHGKIKEEKIDQKELIKSCPKCQTLLVTEKEYKSYLDKEKFKDVIVSTTLSRLPRFIYKVVKDTKILFKDRTKGMTEGGHFAPMTKTITVRWNQHWHDLNNYMGTLAHEYWHAFEHASGFKGNLKEEFQKVVDSVKLGNLGQNAIEDFIFVMQTLTYFGKEDFSEIMKMIRGRWGKKYFEKQYNSGLIGDLQKIQHSIDDQDLYKTINELLAETLADIVTQKQSKQIPQSLIVWMNKKFSSKNQFIKNSEKIIREFLK